MDENTLTQLLELETKFAEAQSMLGDGGVQTQLLMAHLEILSANSTGTSGSELTLEQVADLITESGSFNLALTCSTCHQSLFEDDECAALGKLKDNLEPCCGKMLSTYKDCSELEIAFWWFCLSSPSNCILTMPNYTRFMLTNGVPPALRDRLWGVLTQSANANGEVDEYMQTLYGSLNKDLCPDIGIIFKDVSRTFPELSMFNEYDMKVKFERILNAYSIFDSDMGYCQGLQFIVAPMLFHFKHELKTFNALVRLFEMNRLRTIYDNEMSGLNLWFYQFSHILESELPELGQHFKKLDIDMNIFLSQWFLSFYSITIPFNFLVRMFDVALFEGVKETLLRVGIVILSQNAKLLCTIDEPELIYQHLLSENCWGVFQNDVDCFINSVTQLNVSNFTSEHLSSLEEQHKNTEKTHTSNKSVFNKFIATFKSTAESVLSAPTSTSSAASSEVHRESLFSNANSSTFSFNEDYELVENLYKLCLEKGINDPLLEKVKDRLYPLTQGITPASSA